MKSKLLLLVLLLSGSHVLLAQEQISEAEVNLQKMFIEANRERLLEKYDNAIALYQRILKEDGTNAAAAYEIGRIYHSQRDIEQSIKALRQAIELDPDNEWYYRYLSDIYQESNRNKDGVQLYEEMVKRWPENEHFYLKLAFFLVRDREVNKAIKVYEDLESRIGINDEVSRRKHLLYLGSGDNKRAARELERLIEAYPEEVTYRYMLASFYENIKDKAAARRVYEEILLRAPNDPKAKMFLAGQPSEQTSDQAYLAQLQPLFEQQNIKLDEKMKGILPFITRVAETGDRPLADAVLQLTEILAAVHPGEAKVYAAQGDLLAHSGRPRSAIAAYRQALAEDESVYAVWEQLMQQEYNLGQTSSLLEAADDATAIFPNRPYIYYLMGAAALLQGDTRQAKTALDQVTLMAARDALLKGEAMAALANVYASNGDTKQADAALQQAIELARQSPEQGYWQAQLNVQRGNLAAARKLLEDILKVDADNGRYLALLTQIAYTEKDYKEIRTRLEKLFASTEEPPADLVERYGDVLYQLGEAEAAWVQWNRAQKMGAANETLSRKIADRRLYE